VLGDSSQTNVCVWDVAAAHLNYERALRCNVEECSGDAFLVSAKDRKAWSTEDFTRAVQVTIFFINNSRGLPQRSGSSVFGIETDQIYPDRPTGHLHYRSPPRTVPLRAVLLSPPILPPSFAWDTA
jgi:hypothetical protein